MNCAVHNYFDILPPFIIFSSIFFIKSLWYHALSGRITSWQIDGETMETVTDFIFLGSRITVDGGCSHEVKRCLGDILKSRDINLLIKVCIVKAMVFPVVMYGCESCAIKKAEH